MVVPSEVGIRRVGLLATSVRSVAFVCQAKIYELATHLGVLGRLKGCPLPDELRLQRQMAKAKCSLELLV